MHVRTPNDVGAVIRDRRRQLGLDQATLAKMIGVSRPWVIAVERGHPRAALGLVLRALDALGVRPDVGIGAAPATSGAVDIDDIVAKARTKARVEARTKVRTKARARRRP